MLKKTEFQTLLRTVHQRWNPDAHAMELLERVWVPAPNRFILPVDPFQIGSELGIGVFWDDELAPEISGILRKAPGFKDPEIFLNALDARERRRFTCAHALGRYSYCIETGRDGPWEFVEGRDFFSSRDRDERGALRDRVRSRIPDAEIGFEGIPRHARGRGAGRAVRGDRRRNELSPRPDRMVKAMTRREPWDLDREKARLEFVARGEAAKVAKLEAEADMLGERVATEQENRKLALWHRDRGARPHGAAGSRRQRDLRLVRRGRGLGRPRPRRSGLWLGTTVVEVVAVVLVIVNYLFPNERREYA